MKLKILQPKDSVVPFASWLVLTPKEIITNQNIYFYAALPFTNPPITNNKETLYAEITNFIKRGEEKILKKIQNNEYFIIRNLTLEEYKSLNKILLYANTKINKKYLKSITN